MKLKNWTSSLKRVTEALLLVVLGFTCINCGGRDKEDHRSNPKNDEIEDLKKTVLELQGTIAQINNFVASDFSNCNGSLPPFETKVCQIAQTATAEQQILFVGQLQQVSKIFQSELYGVDCMDTSSPGCPVGGSITARITAAEAVNSTQTADIDAAEANIATATANIATLTSSLATINSRLNNFNGSGNSIETVITSIQSTLTTLSARVTALETTVNSGDIYKTILVCKNVLPTVGPAFEPILLTGDNLKAMAYVVNGNSNGMGLISQAGVTGNYFSTTAASTKTCNFKIYDRTTSIKLCWKNDNRSATTAQIDTACNAPTFASPTAQCTCVN